MMLLKLFLAFLEIGAVSFGGGYGMISLVRETVITNGWLTEKQFADLLAVAESTPGPIAVNMATFVGSGQGGFLGGIAATVGVILPAFVIILAVAHASGSILKRKGVEAFLSGVRPCVVALIIGTAVTMGLSAILGIGSGDLSFDIDLRAIIILLLIAATGFMIKRVLKRKPKPVLMILISAVLGILLYSF